MNGFREHVGDFQELLKGARTSMLDGRFETSAPQAIKQVHKRRKEGPSPSSSGKVVWGGGSLGPGGIPRKDSCGRGK